MLEVRIIVIRPVIKNVKGYGKQIVLRPSNSDVTYWLRRKLLQSKAMSSSYIQVISPLNKIGRNQRCYCSIIQALHACTIFTLWTVSKASERCQRTFLSFYLNWTKERKHSVVHWSKENQDGNTCQNMAHDCELYTCRPYCCFFGGLLGIFFLKFLIADFFKKLNQTFIKSIALFLRSHNQYLKDL